jgi:hypothetical protein
MSAVSFAHTHRTAARRPGSPYVAERPDGVAAGWPAIGRSAARTGATMASMQSLIGNRAVQRFVESGAPPGPMRDHEVAEDRHQIAVVVPRGRPSAGAGGPAPAAARVDAPPGSEERDVAAALASLPAQAPGTEPGAAPAQAQAETAAPEQTAPTPAEAAGPSAAESAQTPSAPASAEASAEAVPAQAPATPTPEAGPGPSPSTAEPAAAPGTQAAGPAGQATGPAMSIPDIDVPELAEIGKSDAVISALAYSGSTTKGGAQPAGFGVTRSFKLSLEDINITSLPGGYLVTATAKHPVTYQIRSGTGPEGQVDISGNTDSDITAANHADIESDLTPDMSDLNGRPPRAKFWCEDLTERHELVHCADDRANAPLVLAQIMAWMNSQTVESWFGAAGLLGQVPKRFATGLLAALTTEAGEKHAYGEGAPAYTLRVESIKARAAGTGYT